MKGSPSIAFLLSFFFPGLGLWYLKKWRLGFLNLGISLVAGLIVWRFVEEPRLWMATLEGIVSGTWAYIVAQEMNMNEKVISQQNVRQVSSEGPPSDKPSM